MELKSCLHAFVGLARTIYLYTPYMTVYLVTSLPKVPYMHRIYIWLWPTLRDCLLVKGSRSKVGIHLACRLHMLVRLLLSGCGWGRMGQGELVPAFVGD
jgi:hypothetical protein